jgi:hypothetical protein
MIYYYCVHMSFSHEFDNTCVMMGSSNTLGPCSLEKPAGSLIQENCLVPELEGSVILLVVPETAMNTFIHDRIFTLVRSAGSQV